ncbi:hypothetical protein GF325_18010 [Candidatus Bathyarchaeota archaeon]|nr:hypothetical protein [Candidatus Bathyarchaeota archaeon]
MRYFFKILVLDLLPETARESGFDSDLEGVFSHWLGQLDQFNDVPGVSIMNAEITLDPDTIVNVEFWMVKNLSTVDLGDAFKGSDSIMLFVNPDDTNTEEIITEYMSIIRREFHFLPMMVVGYDPSQPFTPLCLDLARRVWSSYTCEYMNVNRSSNHGLRNVVHVLLEGVVKYPICGPIHHNTAWLRTSVVWQVLDGIVHGNPGRSEMEFLGRKFYMLHVIAKERKRVEAMLLGAISSRWFELSSRFRLASRVSESLGDERRVKKMKVKHLNYLLDQGNGKYSRRDFKGAAILFENAGHWNRIEGVDFSIMDDIFKKSMDAYASAYDYARVIGLLDQVRDPATYLLELEPKISLGIELLEKKNLLEKANTQLGLITRIFLKLDLGETAREFAEWHARVKLSLLKEKIRQKFIGDSLLLINEIKSLDEKYHLGFTIPDKCIAAVSVFLIERQEFQEFENILPMISDSDIAKNLSNRRTSKEEELEREERQRAEIAKKSVLDRLLVYHDEEKRDALAYATQRRKILFDMIERGTTERARHFMVVNARWLREMGQDDIANDLVFQVSQYMLNHELLITLKELKEFLDEERMKSLATEIIHHARMLVTIDKDNTSLSNYLLHYFKELQRHHFYQEADKLKPIILDRLLEESELLSQDLTPTTATIILGKMESMKQLLGTWNFENHASLDTDRVLISLIEYWFNTGDISQVEHHLNDMNDLDARKKFTYRLNRIQAEKETGKEDIISTNQRKKELHETCKQMRVSYLAAKNALGNDRSKRRELLANLKQQGKIPEKLPCFTRTLENLEKNLKELARNQQELLAWLLDQRMYKEASLAALVKLLITIKEGHLEEIDATSKFINSYPEYVTRKLDEVRGHEILNLVMDCIRMENGSLIRDAFAILENFPLIAGERALIHMIMGREVPEHVFVERDDSKQLALRRKINDILPALLEMATMQLEPLHESLLLKRRILKKEGKITGFEQLQAGKFDKASMLYQDEVHEFLDQDQPLQAWASLWASFFALIKGGDKYQSAITTLRNVLKIIEKSGKVKDHLMLRLMELCFTCMEMGFSAELQEVSTLIDMLPLLQQERYMLDVENFFRNAFKKEKYEG